MAGSILTMTEFRAYIRRQLGSPVICVEIDDTQLDDIICDAIDLAKRYFYGEALYKDYLAFNVVAGTSAYNLSGVDGNEIEDVVDFSARSEGSLNSLFSLSNFAAADIFRGLGYGQGGSYSYGQGLSLASYQSTLIYADEVHNRLGISFVADYSSNSKIMRLIPTPTENGKALISVYRKESNEKLFNHIVIKKLATAMSKKLWGLHLKKYVMQLPGGGTLNGDSIYSDGVTEEEHWLERLVSEAEPPMFFIG